MEDAIGAVEVGAVVVIVELGELLATADAEVLSTAPAEDGATACVVDAGADPPEHPARRTMAAIENAATVPRLR